MRTALLLVLADVPVSAIVAMPASGATHETYRLYSKHLSTTRLDARGARIADRRRPATVGDVYIVTANDYRGTHRHHARRVFATHHTTCTVTAVDLSHLSVSARCDLQLALPGGMVLADRVSGRSSRRRRSVVELSSGTAGSRISNAVGSPRSRTAPRVRTSSSSSRSPLRRLDVARRVSRRAPMWCFRDTR
jgi:hypothetical protein